MAEITQTRANHKRLDPAFHFFVIPVLSLNFLWALYRAGYVAVVIVRHRSDFSSAAFLHQAVLNYLLPAFAQIFISLALLVLALLARAYAAKVQDRIIRLEERQRLAMLLPESHRPRIYELTERQLIALRFASDPELPALAIRAMDENLDSRQIKDAVVTWRPDYWRV